MSFVSILRFARGESHATTSVCSGSPTTECPTSPTTAGHTDAPSCLGRSGRLVVVGPRAGAQAVVTVIVFEQVAAKLLSTLFSALSALRPHRIFTATHSAR